jgi:hypothetical protein
MFIFLFRKDLKKLVKRGAEDKEGGGGGGFLGEN